MGVSKQRGIEAIHYVKENFNSINYLEFLSKIDRTGGAPLIFADNAPWHTGNRARAGAAALGFEVAYNLVARPDLNPIEEIFGHLKNNFRRMRIQNIVAGQDVSATIVVRSLLMYMRARKIANTCERGLQKWRESEYYPVNVNPKPQKRIKISVC